MQPALDASQMLGTRDDFLAGVAALGEADPVQQVEIQHLRDEGLARGRIDLRQSRANVRKPPFVLRTLGVGRIGGCKFLRSGEEPMAARIAGDRGNADTIGLDVAARLRRGAEAAAYRERIAGVLDL